MVEPVKELMTAQEAADVLSVSVKTIRKWLLEGTLTGANTPAGWRIEPADIRAFLERYRPGQSGVPADPDQ